MSFLLRIELSLASLETYSRQRHRDCDRKPVRNHLQGNRKGGNGKDVDEKDDQDVVHEPLGRGALDQELEAVQIVGGNLLAPVGLVLSPSFDLDKILVPWLSGDLDKVPVLKPVWGEE